MAQSTTRFTNAVIQGRHLLRTAVIRLAAPASAILPPFVDWPDDVRHAVHGQSVIVPGGMEFDGREISAFDPRAIEDAVTSLVAADVEAVVISAVFSPVTDSHERRAAAIVSERMPGMPVVCSADIGRIGLLGENAAALNASLIALAERTTDDLWRRFPRWTCMLNCISRRMMAR